MLAVRVSRWSQAAASLLSSQPAVVGWVHSCYARIINVRTPAGRLLTLQGQGRLQAPLALALATDVEALGAHLPVSALVVQDVLATPGPPAALHLRCTDVSVWDGYLPVHPGLTPHVLGRMASALAAWLCLHCPACGLAPLLPALERGPVGCSATCTAVYTALAPLCVARHTFSVTTFLTLVNDLVGLGEGLTPSGDDFLVGLLAILHVTGWLPPVCSPAVRQRFDQCVHLGTAQLSGEFLRCAWEGHFAEPVAMLVRALCTLDTGAWQPHAVALAAVGHSSGVDAMVGIAFGCQLLASQVG